MGKYRKLTATVALALTLLVPQCLSAKTWRINPDGDSAAAFTSITAALASEEVKPGDDLLLDPGIYDEETITIAKDNITITGPGYALAENTDWRESRSAIINRIINIKAHNILLQGLQLPGVQYYEAQSDGKPASGGGIERCCVTQVSFNCAYEASRHHSHVNLRQNNFLATGINANISGFYGSCTITNNIFKGVVSGGVNCTLAHNIFPGISTWSHSSFRTIIAGFKNSVIRNNIIIDNNSESCKGEYLVDFDTAKNNVISNNVFSAPLDKANQNYLDNEWVDATVQSVFVDNVGIDGYFLRDDSPAKGKASDGGDCGIFGGATPYVQSGIPYRQPHIVSAEIPSYPTDGKIVVKLKVAVQND